MNETLRKNMLKSMANMKLAQDILRPMGLEIVPGLDINMTHLAIFDNHGPSYERRCKGHYNIETHRIELGR